VRRYLHQIVGRVGIGSTKPCHKGLVDAGRFLARTIVIENIGETRVSMLQGLAQTHKLRSDGRG
jgi:hypothetical protein